MFPQIQVFRPSLKGPRRTFNDLYQAETKKPIFETPDIEDEEDSEDNVSTPRAVKKLRVPISRNFDGKLRN